MEIKDELFFTSSKLNNKTQTQGEEWSRRLGHISMQGIVQFLLFPFLLKVDVNYQFIHLPCLFVWVLFVFETTTFFYTGECTCVGGSPAQPLMHKVHL